MKRDLEARRWVFAVLEGMFLFLALLPCWGYCAIPQKVNYQGYLTDNHGVPVNGTVQMVFSIYNVATGGSALWTETQTSVQVTDGVYNVNLGDVVLIGLAFDVPYFLGVKVGVDPEMTPRQPLTSVPYAFTASHALSAPGGTPSSTVAALDGTSSAGAATEYSRGDHKHGIGTGAIGSGQIQDGQVGKSKLSATGGTAGQVLGTDGTNLVWQNDGLTLPYGGLAFTTQGAFAVTNLAATGTAIWGLGTDGIGVYGGGNGNPGWGVFGNHTGTGNYGQVGTSTAGVYAYGNGNSRGVWAESQNATAVHGHSGGGYGAYGESASGTGVMGINTASGNYGELGNSLAGIHAVGTGTTLGMFAQSSGGAAVYGQSSSGTAAYFTSSTGYGLVVDSGNVGIGTTNPARKLHVFGSGPRVLVETTDGFNPEVNFKSSGTSDWSIYKHTGTGDLRFYQSGDQFTIKNSTGRVQVKVLEILGGADLSEQFNVKGISEKIQPSPGLVVSIDRNKPGDLVISDKAYDKRVAGIISGAGGVNPGMLMGQEGSAANGTNPVALTGRVYCWADASTGPIEPGDLLTTSSTPGHAMKVADYRKAQGAMIGKAMTGLSQGKGLVLVLVTLQ